MVFVCLAASNCSQTCAQSTELSSGRDVVPLTPSATETLRSMILLLIPEKVMEDDDWGNTTRIQSGVNVRFDDGRLRTSRRWKNVNHGLWQRAEISLIEPERNFELSVSLLPPSDAGHRRYAVHASTPLFIYGRHQQWNLGLRLYSVSAKATARLTLDGIVELRNEVVSDDSGTKFRMLPYVEDADIELSGFQLHSVSHMKGGVVREFGRALRDLVERQVDRREDKLVDRINRKIEDKSDRFELSLGLLNSLAGSQLRQQPVSDDSSADNAQED